MKQINQYITEYIIKKKLDKPIDSEDHCIYFPKTKEELISNIKELFDKGETDLNCIDTSEITDMSYLFKNIRSINFDVSNWDVTEYDRLDCLFFNCQCIETVIGLETWDVSNVKDFTGFFSQCSNLKNVNVSGWKLYNAMITYAMFFGCQDLKTIKGIDTWEFDDNYRIDMMNMFYNCSDLTDIGDIDYWENVVGNKKGMFHNCQQLTLPTWY